MMIFPESDNGANLKMDTIKDGSFGSAAAMAAAATPPPRRGSAFLKNRAFLTFSTVLGRFGSFWIALGPCLDLFRTEILRHR